MQQCVDLANAKLLSVETAKARIQLTQATGCTGLSAFRKLTHHDRHPNTPVEPMHLVKVIGEHMVNYFLELKTQSKLEMKRKFVDASKNLIQLKETLTRKIFLPLLSAF